jgi:selenium metabolism protein YedF
MSKIVDARGLACPQPVILTRKAMAEPGELITIVNSDTSRDNVRRMAEKSGRSVRIEEKGDDYHLFISAVGDKAGGVQAPAATPEPQTSTGVAVGEPAVLVVPGKTMGRDDEQLGGILVRGFFHTLGELERRPDTVIFINGGVWLAIDDSPILEDLRTLENQGVKLLACGTCLSHYEIKDRLAVGQISNMYEIAETIFAAGKIVTL